MNRVAVVINEIGEIGIDNDLVTRSSENISLLANGCICCSVRTDMQETLRDLFARHHSGEIPEFDRVIIETTGLADPAPVVQTLASRFSCKLCAPNRPLRFAKALYDGVGKVLMGAGLPSWRASNALTNLGQSAPLSRTHSSLTIQSPRSNNGNTV